MGTPLSLAHPWIWKYIVDDVVAARRPERLIPAVGVMLGLHFLGSALGALRGNLLERLGHRFVQDLREELHSRLQAQSLGYLHERRSGDVVARIVGDVDVLQEVAVSGTETVLSNAYSFVIVAISLLVLSPLLGAMTLAPILVVWLLVRVFNVRVKRLYRAARDRLGDVSAGLQENLQGAVVVRAFAREDAERERFGALTADYRGLQDRATDARTLFLPMTQFVGFLSNAVAIGVGAWLVLEGRFSVGGLVAYRGYWWQLYSPVQSLAQINDLYQRGAAAAGRVMELLQSEPALVDRPGAREVSRIRGSIRFEGVHFAYGERPVLAGLDLEILPGEIVGIVGESGAGKSTLVNLISRFYDPQAGRVLIDGSDVRDLAQRSLRRHIGLVLQDTLLFSGTVRENVSYGRPEATLQEIREAARQANALQFIESDLPHGWDTLVGERGVKLSGGQRQRISIARTFLVNPEILVLDEATSAVEPESERLIQQALERLTEGRTALVISHRLSLVRGADRILVMDAGRIVEQGSHAELLARSGAYAAMYRLQVGAGTEAPAVREAAEGSDGAP